MDLIWQTPWNGEEELKELIMPSILSELWGLHIFHSAGLLLPFEPRDLATRSEQCTNRSLFGGLGCFAPIENCAIAPILLVAPKREYFLTIGNLAYPSMSPVQRLFVGEAKRFRFRLSPTQIHEILAPLVIPSESLCISVPYKPLDQVPSLGGWESELSSLTGSEFFTE